MSHLCFREKVFNDLHIQDNDPGILTAINDIFREFGDRASVQKSKMGFDIVAMDLDTLTGDQGRLVSNLYVDKEVYLTDNSIDTVKSNNGDDQFLIRIKGATVSGGLFTLVTQDVDLTGSDVTLVTPLARVFSVENISATDMNGRIVISTGSVGITGGVVDEVDQDKVYFFSNNQSTETKNFTAKGAYTIPDGYYGIIDKTFSGSTRANSTYTRTHIQIRKPGKVFVNKYVFIGGNSGATSIHLDNYIVVEPNSDIQINIKGSYAGSDVIAGFSGFLAKII